MDSVERDGIAYKAGDYVYVTPTSENARSSNHIMRVERVFKVSSTLQPEKSALFCIIPEGLR